MCVLIHIYIHTYIYTHAYIYIHTYMCVYTCICTHTLMAYAGSLTSQNNERKLENKLKEYVIKDKRRAKSCGRTGSLEIASCFNNYILVY